jgi:hypothetical protein
VTANKVNIMMSVSRRNHGNQTDGSSLIILIILNTRASVFRRVNIPLDFGANRITPLV